MDMGPAAYQSNIRQVVVAVVAVYVQVSLEAFQKLPGILVGAGGPVIIQNNGQPVLSCAVKPEKRPACSGSSRLMQHLKLGFISMQDLLL